MCLGVAEFFGRSRGRWEGRYPQGDYTDCAKYAALNQTLHNYDLNAEDSMLRFTCTEAEFSSIVMAHDEEAARMAFSVLESSNPGCYRCLIACDSMDCAQAHCVAASSSTPIPLLCSVVICDRCLH